VLDSTRKRLLETLKPDDVVLDIGGWADPLPRADWVMDMMPYDTRGLYARRGWVEDRDQEAGERFSADTWITRDICSHEPFPFEDESIDFVICSHTLEDVRDPIWVCSEMNRIAKAGYIEIPSRLEEQTWGIHLGEFVGWAHHHWLIDVGENNIEFVFKHHAIHGNPDYYFPREFVDQLSEEEKVQSLWWEGSFDFSEKVMFEERDATEVYLGEFVQRELAARGLPTDRTPSNGSRSFAQRLKGRVGKLVKPS
jgi:hypothetical protein